MHHPTDRITHTTAFVTSVGALALRTDSEVKTEIFNFCLYGVGDNIW